MGRGNEMGFGQLRFGNCYWNTLPRHFSRPICGGKLPEKARAIRSCAQMIPRFDQSRRLVQSGLHDIRRATFHPVIISFGINLVDPPKTPELPFVVVIVSVVVTIISYKPAA